MLTNKKPVIVLISGLFVTTKMRSRFPVRATNIVVEYKTVICAGLGPEEMGLPIEELNPINKNHVT